MKADVHHFGYHSRTAVDRHHSLSISRLKKIQVDSEFLLMRDQLRVSAAKLLKQESEPHGLDGGDELEVEIARQREQSRQASEDRNVF